ncbi:MAG: sporulation protein YhbH [Ammonifex sp.]|nr:MAG: sporulation protein YhbH [Ammonifex sp.]
MADFTVCREDWSLHRKGDADAKRHREKVKEAVRSRISDIVTEESIVLSNGDKVLRVPIRSLEEFRFRFDPGKMQHVGQGNGKLGVGDLVTVKRFPGKGKGAGEEPGLDYHEAEVSIDEIAEVVFEELSLPHLEPQREASVMTESTDFTDIRKKGISSNVDRKRTLLAVLRRNALKGSPGFHGIRPEDLRFRTWNVRRAPETGAAVLAMMDTSGSMGPFEKFVGRSFFFWMVRFLRANYQNVETAFLAHHTEARETTEEEFFRRGESGGTRCSSVYRLALDVINKRFLPRDYNVYAFHFSDGDNLTSDNELCIDLVQKLLQVTNMVGYGEIEGPYYYTSTLKNAYRVIDHPRFVAVTLRDKTDVYKVLKTFFARRE